MAAVRTAARARAGIHGVVEQVEHPGMQVNHVDLETFERVVDDVCREYEVVPLDVVVAALRREAELPANAATPGELSAERRRVAREVVGEVDGQAGERVVDAIVCRPGGS